ncbi:MAG: MFS transporter [Actinomycetota bacterium]|nr:MFS transporter [Actinomycetota bacterium]
MTQTTTAPSEQVLVQRRTVRVLAMVQILAGVGIAAPIAAGGPLAEQVGGSTALAGLASTANVLGSALLALPLARLMAARGRRTGLAAGFLLGAGGAVLLVAAAVADLFVLLCLASVLLGSAIAASLQARFAATDLASAATSGRALSVVVWATTVGAVLGPNLLEPGRAVAGWLGLPELTGPYVFTAVALVAAAAVVLIALRPDPLLESRRLAAGASARSGGVVAVPEPRSPEPHGRLRRAARAVAASPPALLALAAVSTAHTVMVAVMVMTPVHLHAGGSSYRALGLVISAHIAGMYALSPVMGWLADRWGRVPVVLLGQATLVTAVLTTGTAGHDAGRVAIGLTLLGLGWSANLVAGSTLLSESVALRFRPDVQGGADTVMGLCGAAGGALAGVALGLWGYAGLSLAAGLLVAPVVVLAVWASRAGTTPSS